MTQFSLPFIPLSRITGRTYTSGTAGVCSVTKVEIAMKYWPVNIVLVAFTICLFGCGPSEKPNDPGTTPTVDTPNSDPLPQVINDPPSEEDPIPPKPVEPAEVPTEDSESTKLTKKHAAMLVSEDGDRQAASDYFDGLGEEAIVPLLALVNDEDLDTRKGAVFYLIGKFEPENPEMVAAIAGKLSDEDRAVRHLALQMVRFFPVETLPETLPRLAEMLDPQKEHESNRLAVARLLKSLSSNKELIIPSLAKAAQSDPDEQVRSACIDAIFAIAPAELYVPILKNALMTETKAAIRRNAARRLELSGKAAEPAIEALAKALSDTDKDTRTSATNALLNLGEPAIPALIEQLKSPSRSAKLRAILVLGRLKKAAIPSLDALRAAAKDPDPEVQKLAKTVVKYLENLR
ncbi:MAG: HEAT repeat protein [Pirellulaceae bacterium]